MTTGSGVISEWEARLTNLRFSLMRLGALAALYAVKLTEVGRERAETRNHNAQQPASPHGVLFLRLARASYALA